MGEWEITRQWDFAEGNFFCQVMGTWGGVILTIWKLFKAKSSFLWTSIEVKISMTCVSIEYEIKTKMVQEQWIQLKMKFL